MNEQETNKFRNDRAVYKKSARKKANKRSNAGLSRQLREGRTDNSSHPSRGGSNGYPLWYRLEVMQFVQDYGMQAAHQHFQVSLVTLYRWARRIRPHRQNGNADRSTLIGRDQMLLSMCLFLHPRADSDHIATFIVNNGGNVYTRQEISKRCHELRLGIKRSSLKAYEAFTPFNRFRTIAFRQHPPPVGVHTVERHQLADIDEANFILKKIESRVGRAARPMRVHDVGHYTRGARHITLLMAIEPGNPNIPLNENGSIRYPRRWFLITRENVDQHVFSRFMDQICQDIEQNPLPGDHTKIFMWDNLSVHLTPLVWATVNARPTRDVFQFETVARPPYSPEIAPIEYMFCQITTFLTSRIVYDWNEHTLEIELRNAVLSVGMNGHADNTFDHCGY